MSNLKTPKKMEEITPIGRQNIDLLSRLSVIFCLMNGITPTDEFVAVFTSAIMTYISCWYAEQGRTFNPATDAVEEDAVKFAFGRAQELANLASISAQTGIGMEGFGE